MSSLPLSEDIIVNILSRLPVKSILRFRCVCKSWCRLFREPDFIKYHLDHETEKENFSLLWNYKEEICSTDYSYEYSSSSLSSKLHNETVHLDCSVDAELELKFYYDYEKQMRNRTCDNYFSRDSFSIKNSCNGVVCLIAPRIVVLWNPCTRETMKIPCIYGSVIGFGYDSETGEFKMVELSKIDPIKRRRTGTGYSKDWENSLRVYSFDQSNSWKVIPKVPYKSTSYDIIFFNGAFHWFARPCSGSKQVLVSFVMRDESFHEVLLPRDDLTSSLTEVGVLGGLLALTHTLYHTRTEIWVMKKEYRGTNSWTQLCIINLQMICEHPLRRLTVVRSFKNGELLFQMCPPSQDGTCLFLYDPNHEKGRAVEILGMPSQIQTHYISINSYIRTLVSVVSNTSKAATQRKMTLRSWKKKQLLR